MTAFLKSKWTLGILALIVIALIIWRVTAHGAPAYQFATVAQGSITQTVSVTGATTPIATVSLGFQNAGTISHVYYQLGDTVKAGDVIAQLDTASLSAALAQAQANVTAQQATLAGLQAGPQQTSVAASQASLATAQQNLANSYAGIPAASASDYTKANDAVRTQLGTLFSNAETNQPQLIFVTSNSQAGINATNIRVSASDELNAWQNELSSGTASSSPDALASILQRDLLHLAVAENLFNAMSTALAGNTNLTASELASAKANVTAGQTEVNTAISDLTTISQTIASQKTAVAQAQANLAVAQTGSTPQAIAAQEAQIQQAQAAVSSAQANLANSEIVAPIGGVLTQQDAKVGQVATPGTPLVSIIGRGGFEVDAGVSETDVGKLAIGDMATMTLDAFPGQTFAGSVFYIAPAQTNTNGVITYLTKISFANPDPALKSGLTANVDIQTKQDQNALILPEYAILQNDQGTFVEVLKNGKIVDMPVTLGIQDENGNVEVTSGVSAGEQVLNIGLKQQ